MKLRSALGTALLLMPACYSGTQASDDPAAWGQSESAGTVGTGDGGISHSCLEPFTPRSYLRRLTRFEYNNTVRDLLGDDTSPANAFPSEEIGNGFGNDADAQSVSSLLAEQYSSVAEGIATRVTSSPERLAALHTCASELSEDADDATEAACVRDLLERFVPRAYRRPASAEEIDELVELQRAVRAASDFRVSIAAVVEAVLQSPDFLYRVEWGVLDEDGRRRPNGYEMATRLSYLFWGTMPDDALFEAAERGELLTAESVYAEASRLLDDPRARATVRFFFDNLLPISSLSQLERDPVRYPTFSGAIGALMREETHRFLEFELFESTGTWSGALTAPYTFVNATLAEYYGIPNVVGDEFRRVDLDTTKRLGVLTQGGVVAGTIHSNETNPVVRGAFVMHKILCGDIPLPTGDILAEIKPPDPDTGATARERYAKHSEDPACAGCHALMDPIGLALENYDAVGLWRDSENGVTIDASGAVPGGEGTVAGPIDLVRQLADDERTQACFARHWANFAYGRTHARDDECVLPDLEKRFADAHYDVRELLLALTQTDAFLYLPEASS